MKEKRERENKSCPRAKKLPPPPQIQFAMVTGKKKSFNREGGEKELPACLLRSLKKMGKEEEKF